MDEQAWQVMKKVFQEALECAPKDRAKLLDAACAHDVEVRAEVEALLEEHDKDGPVTGSAVEAPSMSARDEDELGTVIDRYKLLQKIGEGGFGVVYMAEQTEPVHRKVALKILKLGMDTRQVIARFEAERQALAMMDHPNIARVFDAGSTNTGRPYFVMELVKGIPITEYCDQAILSTNERLGLFTSVCLAVQYAHMKGVIHRDLKPSNLLVTLHDGEPVVKVIDFGIAKATGQRLTDKTLFTEFRQMLGTPEYMAPEQAGISGLDVDTRADVYSLGVLLYELLTGARPLELATLQQRGYDEVVRMIREADPAKPSTRVSTLGDRLTAIARYRRTSPQALRRRFHGDLDWIVMKALEKDRSRRYQTANGLADDVRRHIAHQPVEAGPPTVVYRLRKYVRRHTVGVAAGSAVVAALSIGGVLAASGYASAKDQRDAALESATEANLQRGAAVAARESEREAKLEAQANEVRARTEALKSETVVGLLGSMLSSADPHEIHGPGYTVRQLLDDFDSSLGNRLEEQPEVEFVVRQAMGRAYLSLSQRDTAERHLARALDLARGELNADPTALAGSLQSWAQLQHDRGLYDEAEGTVRETLGLLSWPGEESEEIADGMLLLGDVLRHVSRYGESERLHHDALAMTRRVVGEECPGVAGILHSLADLVAEQGKYSEAERLYVQALEMARKVYGEVHLELAPNLSGLAGVLEEQGRVAEAEQLHREALGMARKSLGDEDPATAKYLRSLALAIWGRGNYAEAENLLREALETSRRFDGDHASVAVSLDDLAGVLVDQGEYAEAEQLYREAMEMGRRLHGEVHPYLATYMNNMGLVLNLQGKFAEAEPILREALEMTRATLDELHPGVLTCLENLASALRNQGQWVEAEVVISEILEMRRRRFGDEDARVAASLDSLATALGNQGKWGEAAKLHREALELGRRLLPKDHPTVASYLDHLVHVLKQAGDRLGAGRVLLDSARFQEALPLLRLHLDDCMASPAEDAVTLAEAMSLLGGCLLGQGDPEQAELLLLEGFEGLQATPEETRDQRVQAAAWLVHLYESQSEPDEAEYWRAAIEE